MTRLACISLWQPWAGGLFEPVERRKIHETRHWPAPARLIGQRIAIHAAKRKMTYDDLCVAEDCGWDVAGWAHGAIIGTVTLEACEQMTARLQYWSRVDHLAGNWDPGRYAWRMADPELLAEPIPTVGRQGFWTSEIRT